LVPFFTTFLATCHYRYSWRFPLHYRCALCLHYYHPCPTTTTYLPPTPPNLPALPPHLCSPCRPIPPAPYFLVIDNAGGRAGSLPPGRLLCRQCGSWSAAGWTRRRRLRHATACIGVGPHSPLPPSFPYCSGWWCSPHCPVLELLPILPSTCLFPLPCPSHLLHCLLLILVAPTWVSHLSGSAAFCTSLPRGTERVPYSLFG